MNVFTRSQFPPGGWQFIQPQTGWRAPTPVSSTFDQTVHLIIAHRRGNPTITNKHQLALDVTTVGNELEAYTRKRLNLPAAGAPVVPKIHPPSALPQRSGVAVAAVDSNDRNSVAFGIKRSAQGGAVLVDWLRSGAAPVSQEVADGRGRVCATCSYNVTGSWYTVAPATLIKQALELRKDLKLATPYDAELKSCNVCKCLNRLKIWCPRGHIMQQTRPEIMREFPSHCWIIAQDT